MSEPIVHPLVPDDRRWIPALGMLSALVGVLALPFPKFILSAIVVGHIAHAVAKSSNRALWSEVMAIAGFSLGYFAFALSLIPTVSYRLSYYREAADSAILESTILDRQKALVGKRNMTCIDLKPFSTASFTDSIASPKLIFANNLAAFPTGQRVFCDVKFDVQGLVQLMGQSLVRLDKKFPRAAAGIPIGKRFDQLHLLHGALWLSSRGDPIAKLVLHYEDGAKREIPIVAGRHVDDWWGFLSEENLEKGTQIAWFGTNQTLSQRFPEKRLRVYKSTFGNPRPEAYVLSLDYVSLAGNAAPFMIGLTIESKEAIAMALDEIRLENP